MNDENYKKGFDDAMKSCGGCGLCYGKGYSSTIRGYHVKGETVPLLVPQISFCGCSRGDQLRSITRGRMEFVN